jgi:streptogramin lyase
MTWGGRAGTTALVATLLVAACAAPPSTSRPQRQSAPPDASQRVSSPSASVGIATARTPRPTPTLPAGVDQVIRLSGAPTSLGAGFGSLWVTSHRGSRLHRVDPDTNAIEAQVDIGSAQCGELAFGDDLVWVSSCSNFNSFFRVEPLTNRVVGSDRWPGASVAFGAGSVWAVLENSTPGAVGRFDLGTYALAARIPVGGGAGFLAYGFGSAWVSNWSDGTVQRIDPEKNVVAATFLVGPPGVEGSGLMAVGEDAVWVGSVGEGSVYRIDPMSDTVERIDLGLTKLTQNWDLYIEATPGSIWLRTSDDTIARIDTGTRQIVATYPASGGGGDMAVAFGSLWVANFAADTLWRIGIDEPG